ncbi:hypothetical protein GCM10010174_29230 [Kutzneria viridogrisea]|uniref:ABC transporter domain-containing protein n=2 Tax=Kutzneria TaxID=43356 RepID=W5WBK6_9PSEU|nr:ATP-binding cassette domain-containing protein [Kutzneria albida]AHH97931.1 hypothetical protein KALB_4569 [Kutzneria albida DSM 43870]MBA8924414.1 ABC-type multidrug transport system ATPase subunit [Kutzneria viridogrisea]
MRVTGVALHARGLAVAGSRGSVFDGVDLDLPAGGLLAVHGPGGSGRTSLLLALSGRMRLAAGAIAVGKHRLPGDERAVRELVGVARAEPAVALEERLRVDELVRERCWTGREVTPARVHEAMDLVGVRAPGRDLVEDLPPWTATLFAVALALAERPRALVIDDVDRDCPREQVTEVWQALDRLRHNGCTVLAGCCDPPGPGGEPVLVELPRRSVDRLEVRR